MCKYLVSLLLVLCFAVGTARAEEPVYFQAPPEAREDVATWRSARLWSVSGVAVPGIALLVLGNLASGEKDVSEGMKIGMAGSLVLAGGVGASLGYYRAGRPVYATASALTRTGLLVGGFLLDRSLADRCCEDEADGPMPIFTMTALGAVVAWTIADIYRIEQSALAAERVQRVRIAPIATADAMGLGLAGTF